MDIRMVPMLDFLAREALITTIDPDTIVEHWVKTIKHFGQSGSHCFQFSELMSIEKIGMTQTATFQRALQKLNRRLLLRKIFESHAVKPSASASVNNMEIPTGAIPGVCIGSKSGGRFSP
jgi:hypothetical protein